MPTVCIKALISPVPKSANKYPYVPLNYIPISTVFSDLINNCVIKYCELGDLLVDEQGGFRKKRACVDHLYTITFIIRNRFSENKSTFHVL